MIELQDWIRDRIGATPEQIAQYCDRWKITEFALFGSVLRDDFRSDSDIDVLVTFAVDPKRSLFDWIDMKDELKAMFDREVDLVDKQRLKNPYRRREILNTYQVIYASE